MSIPRVRYAEKQVLRAADLSDEQAYQMNLRRRHILAAHEWGIVYGLMPHCQPDIEGFWVQPGLAVDGFGREIAVPQPYCYPCLLPSGLFDIWLLYAESPHTRPQPGVYACGPGQHNRWIERFTLEVTPAPAEETDPWQPPGMAAADLNFAAWDAPPGDPSRRWPVYLGRVEINGLESQVKPVARPYVGLIGETVTAASQGARMEIGSEQGGGWRFAISLPDSTTGLLEDNRLVIDSYGRNTLRGRVVLQLSAEQNDRQDEADLILPARDPAKEPPYGLSLEKPIDAPGQATPWRMYHAQVKPPAQDGQPPAPPLDQLRMELFNPGDQGQPDLYELVIGATEKVIDASTMTEEEKFCPRLRIGADCSVTVYGDVMLTGSLTQGPIPADPTDPRFVEAIVDSIGRGISASTVESTLEIEIRNPGEVEVMPVAGEPWTYQVTLQNKGTAPVTDIRVNLIVIMPNEALTEPLPVISKLSPNDSISFSRQVTPQQGGTLTVSVTAVGFGPQFRTMSKQANRDFNITEIVIN